MHLLLLSKQFHFLLRHARPLKKITFTASNALSRPLKALENLHKALLSIQETLLEIFLEKEQYCYFVYMYVECFSLNKELLSKFYG
jgi:hypothetical protein